MTTAFIDRTINGNHTFACALTTRGGVCDCWPEQAAATPAVSTTPPETDSVEHCARCERRAGSAHVLVDLDGINQLCERCALHAQDAELADATQVIDL
jgi:hypothetical protein